MGILLYDIQCIIRAVRPCTFRNSNFAINGLHLHTVTHETHIYAEYKCKYEFGVLSRTGAAIQKIEAVSGWHPLHSPVELPRTGANAALVNRLERQTGQARPS